MKSCTIDKVSESLWSAARSVGPPGVFYHKRMLALWERVHGWRSLVFTADDAMFVGFVKSTVAGEVLYSLPFGWYGGFVGSGAGESFRLEGLSAIRSRRFSQENIVEWAADNMPVYDSRYSRHEHFTHMLDLTERIGYSENTRRNIEKSEASGVELGRLKSGDCGMYENLLKEHEILTGKRRRIRVEFLNELVRLGDSSESGVTVQGAWSGDNLIACHIYFSTESDVFYFDGVSNKEGRDLLANFLLFDSTIVEARKNGVQRVNFGSSPTADEGLRRFKENWGAEQVKYIEYSRSSRVRSWIESIRGRS